MRRVARVRSIASEPAREDAPCASSWVTIHRETGSAVASALGAREDRANRPRDTVAAHRRCGCGITRLSLRRKLVDLVTARMGQARLNEIDVLERAVGEAVFVEFFL